jgi:hypothetical protein
MNRCTAAMGVVILTEIAAVETAKRDSELTDS